MHDLKKLRVGVAGLNMGYSHLNSYKKDPRVELYAICDNDPRWLEFVANAENPVKKYGCFDEMIKDPEIDAISVALPTRYHALATIAALEEGKHVLCEKPMAVCHKEALEMIRASEKAGKKLMISHQQRFGSDIQLMKNRQAAGFFGDIYFMRIAWRRPLGMMPDRFTIRGNGDIYNRNWFNEKDNGGGVLRDLGTHMIDLALYLSGFPEMEGAYGSLYRKFFPEGYDGSYPVDAEDLANAHIKFKNGMSVQLEVSFGSHVENEIVLTEIYGTNGGASRRNGEVKFFSSSGDGSFAEIVKNCKIKTKSSQEHFVDAILGDHEVPVTAAQGAEVVRILDAIYESGGMIL